MRSSTEDPTDEESAADSRRWAPDNAEGLHAYVVTKYSWGQEWSRIEYASSLTAAKGAWGWTRERYTTVKVRRAKAVDVPVGAVLGGA